MHTSHIYLCVNSFRYIFLVKTLADIADRALKTSAPIGAREVKLEIITDRPT